jgi:hypothetical protein
MKTQSLRNFLKLGISIPACLLISAGIPRAEAQTIPNNILKSSSGAGGQGTPSILREEGAGNAKYVSAEEGVRITFPKGAVAKKGDQVSGYTFHSAIKPAQEETKLCYKVKFDKDFEWTKGGKLPGLCGGTKDGKNIVGGGEPSSEGFSMRPMWRPDGVLESYFYHSGKWTSKDTQHGDRMAGPPNTVTRDKWQEVCMEVKMNMPGVSNGIMKISVDGKQVANRTDMMWRKEGKNFAVDRLCFETFYGGSDSSYAPTKDTHLNIKDLVITSGGSQSKPGVASASANVGSTDQSDSTSSGGNSSSQRSPSANRPSIGR